MTTLLAALIGFFSSIIPEFLKIFKDHKDKKHELDLFDRQIKISRSFQNDKLQEIEQHNKYSPNIAEMSALYSNYNSGVSWVDGFNATVRPMLAYSFFFLYAFIKLKQYQFLQVASELDYNLAMLWTLEDQAIFTSIISFYFGQRTFRKILK